MIASTMIERVRAQVSLALNDQMNIVDRDYVAGDNSLFLKFEIHNIAVGTIVSAGFNSWYVLGVDETSNSLLVMASPNGEPDFNIPAGTRLRVKPRVTDYQIAQWLNDQIEVMSSPNSGLYGVGTWTARVHSADATFDVPDEFEQCLDVLTVRYVRASNSRFGWFPVQKWRLERGQGPLRVHVLGDPHMDGVYEVVFKMPFGRILNHNTNVPDECFIPGSMLDIPVVGAAAMFALAAEGQRVQLAAQGDTRRADEVPVQANWNYSSQLFRTRDRRIRDEAARLSIKYPDTRGRW